MLEGSCLFADLDDLPDCDEAQSSPTASRPDSFKAVDVIESMNVLTHECKLQDIPVSHNLSPKIRYRLEDEFCVHNLFTHNSIGSNA